MNSLPISHSYCLCDPFCDYLNITTPKINQDAVFALIQPFLDVIGCLEQFAGLFSCAGGFGTFKVYVRGQVCVFSASAGVLNAFRQLNMFDEYLALFYDFEHRVSMMHATVDLRLDAPELLEVIYQKASTGQISLTRKAIDPKNVSRLIGKNLEGIDTGTVYLGKKENSDVWGKAYDKRQERIQKGFPDPGPTLRIEIAIQSDMGATIRDASNPFNIFYHFAQRSLVIPPPSFQGWEPHGNGFIIDKKPAADLTTWQRIKGIIENSNDFKRVIEMAVLDYGKDAAKELDSIIRQRILLSERAKALELPTG